MAKLNVSSAKKRLDGYCILIIDGKHAKCLTILNNNLGEKDFVSPPPVFEDRAGYFKGTSGGGISDEQQVAQEFKKRFYKDVLAQVSDDLRAKKYEKLIIMCPKEDTSVIEKYFDADLKKAFVGFKEGNYVKIGENEILEKVLEVIS